MISSIRRGREKGEATTQHLFGDIGIEDIWVERRPLEFKYKRLQKGRTVCMGVCKTIEKKDREREG